MMIRRRRIVKRGGVWKRRMLEEETKVEGESVCRNVVGRRKFEEGGEEPGGDEEFFEWLEAG
jgi:hypothetical protein